MDAMDGGAPLVLVADDEPRNLEVVSSMLATDGLNVAVATEGSMVIEFARTDNPDVILLDAMMPGMSGFETCRRLKSDQKTSGIPIIFLTALADAEHRREGLKLGAIDYVLKPFDQIELLSRVQIQISLRRATRALKERNLRLEEQIRRREAAEVALSSLAKELAERTDELGRSNALLRVELEERQRAEAARAALKEEIIRAQRERLLELSTPLIPITDRILAMPLVGTLDVERAEQVIEAGLRGAKERACEFMIIDVTGVRSVDLGAAEMLVRLARGLRLLGQRTMITGINAEMAQSLVLLDIQLDGLVTMGSLQSGIAYAMGARLDRPRGIETTRPARP